jgi:hypothetical protein
MQVAILLVPLQTFRHDLKLDRDGRSDRDGDHELAVHGLFPPTLSPKAGEEDGAPDGFVSPVGPNHLEITLSPHNPSMIPASWFVCSSALKFLRNQSLAVAGVLGRRRNASSFWSASDGLSFA